MLLKLPIILSGNSFNFYLLFPKLLPTFYYKSMQKCYKNLNKSYLYIATIYYLSLSLNVQLIKAFPYVLSWIQAIFDCGFEIMEA